MENDIFDLLIRITAASTAAIFLVFGLRQVVRRFFGASNAYLLWLLVPAAMLTSVLPAPTITRPSETLAVEAIQNGVPISEDHAAILPHAPSPQVILSVTDISSTSGSTAISDARLGSQETSADTQVLNSQWFQDLRAQVSSFPWALALCASWLLGAGISLSILIYRQYRFVQALGTLREEPGKVFVTVLKGFGPALVGALRPRLIVPADFRENYTPAEQALILAHERTHLARGDAQVNAFAALMKCVFWFNPLVAFALKRFHIDQEVACDADVLRERTGEQSLYARALLKAQLAAHGVPLGCAWPAGNGHPLRERIAALGGNYGPTHKRANAIILILAISGLSAAAWSLQPPAYVANPADDVPEDAAESAVVKNMRSVEAQSASQALPQVRPIPHVAPIPKVVPLARVDSSTHAIVAPTVRPGLVAAPIGAPSHRIRVPIHHDKEEWQPDGDSYIDSLQAAGLKNLDVEELIALRVQGVDAHYIAALKESGFEMDVETLIAFKVQDVTPDYIREIRTVWPNLDAEEIIAMRIQGVKASDAEGFKEIGFEKLSAEQVIAFQVMGVTPDYVKSLRDAGIEKRDPDQYVWAKSMGVTADYIKHLSDRGFEDLTLDKVVQLKSVGVD